MCSFGTLMPKELRLQKTCTFVNNVEMLICAFIIYLCTFLVTSGISPRKNTGFFCFNPSLENKLCLYQVYLEQSSLINIYFKSKYTIYLYKTCLKIHDINVQANNAIFLYISAYFSFFNKDTIN